jgi:hypothetical protein
MKRKFPRITRIVELTAKSDKGKRCDWCGRKIKHGELIFPFGNREVFELSEAGEDAKVCFKDDIFRLNYRERMKIIEHFSTIQKQFSFEICQRCFENLTGMKVIHHHIGFVPEREEELCKVDYNLREQGEE